MNREIPEGATVKFRHQRIIRLPPSQSGIACDLLTAAEYRERGLNPEPKGGLTTCLIKTDDGTFSVGQAWCSPHDNYNRRTGRNIALGRALKDLEAQ